jgi:death-on-curing protein
MPQEQPSLITDLLHQIEIALGEPLDFASTDPATILTKVRVLTAAATYFNVLALQEFGGRSGAAREPGIVEQVVSAAFQTFAGFDPHPGPFDKAAMLLRGIVAGHPFNDGNKRTGFLIAAYFLSQLGIPEPEGLESGAATEDAEALCLRISVGQIRDVEVIALELRRLWEQ